MAKLDQRLKALEGLRSRPTGDMRTMTDGDLWRIVVGPSGPCMDCLSDEQVDEVLAAALHGKTQTGDVS